MTEWARELAKVAQSRFEERNKDCQCMHCKARNTKPRQ